MMFFLRAVLTEMNAPRELQRVTQEYVIPRRSRLMSLVAQLKLLTKNLHAFWGGGGWK